MQVRTYMRPTYITMLAHPFERASLTGFVPSDVPDDVLPLDALRGLPREMPPVTGVYFMWRGPQLIYIGSAREDLESRMFDHGRARLGLRRGPRYPFTSVTCMEHGLRGLQDLEYRYIQAYMPPFNKEFNYAGWGRRVSETRDD